MHPRKRSSMIANMHKTLTKRFIRKHITRNAAMTKPAANGQEEHEDRKRIRTTKFSINNMHDWRNENITINGNELAFDADLLNHAISEVAEAGGNNPCSSGKPVEVRSEQSRNLYTVIVDKDMFPAADLAVTNPVNGLCEQFNGIPDVGAWILTTESTARYGHAMHAWSR